MYVLASINFLCIRAYAYFCNSLYTFENIAFIMIMDNTWSTLPITHRMTDPVGPASKHYLDRSMLNFRDRSLRWWIIVPERLKIEAPYRDFV